MLLVYIYLPRREAVRRRRSKGKCGGAVRAVDHVDPTSIQMVELIDKAQLELPQPETREADAERCVDQHVSNFEFHRADD